MIEIDETHNPNRRSWVASANAGSDFPIQNLPLGVFSWDGATPRGGVAIGDEIVDLRALIATGLVTGDAAQAAEAASGLNLNPLLALGRAPRHALRLRLSELLSDETGRPFMAGVLRRAAECRLHLPAQVGDYTDFYVGIHHATHVGRLFRPDHPLLPNYKHLPIGYHGRASSLVVSGAPVRRPNGQRKAPDQTAPQFGPSEKLDYELEIGVWIGPGNQLGEPIPVDRASERVAGYCLLNDWSARDIQAWEYQPLGPFLSKNFATSVSPWIVTPEALAPFRTPQAQRGKDDPQPLPYLYDSRDQSGGALDVELDILLSTAKMREQGLEPHRLSRSNARYLYWTVAQMIAHHTSGGCNLAPGDLFGTGTISGPDRNEMGSLLETTIGGAEPVGLPSGEKRSFLADGDEVLMRGNCRRSGFQTIGFGECRARILPAPHARHV